MSWDRFLELLCDILLDSLNAFFFIRLQLALFYSLRLVIRVEKGLWCVLNPVY